MGASSMLSYYRHVNDGYEAGFVYSLGDRGFFAEITTVARAMIQAWARGRRMLLDSRDFSYRCRDGWSDYFEPFCADAGEVDPASIENWIRFTRSGDRQPFQRLRAFQPETLRFGAVELRGFQQIMRHFMLLIFRPTEACRAEVGRLRASLGLADDYLAIHVRRGDKVGDEDVSYPARRYLDALGRLGDAAIFVMSDDHRAAVEVRRELRARGLANPVASLCREEHTGFDVWALREGRPFAGGNRPLSGEAALRSYVFTETVRLIAETTIAARSRRFVSTFGSNVGKSVWYVHDDPGACTLLSDSETHSRPATAATDRA